MKIFCAIVCLRSYFSYGWFVLFMKVMSARQVSQPLRIVIDHNCGFFVCSASITNGPSQKCFGPNLVECGEFWFDVS